MNNGYPRNVSIVVTALLILGWTSSGCVKAPDTVYLVDKKTVLEHQAGGELTALENDLNDSALQPHCEPFTPGQLEAEGVAGGGVSSVAGLYAATRTDAQRIDELLIRRCVGEARSGLLEETPGTCTGTVNGDEITRLVQRENRNRRQVWSYIQREMPGTEEEAIRQAWWKNHLEQVVCGGQIQREDGSWFVKRCGGEAHAPRRNGERVAAPEAVPDADGVRAGEPESGEAGTGEGDVSP